MEDSVSHSWADEPEGGYTVTPPIKLNPEGWPGFTPEQLEKLQQMAEDAARELRSYRVQAQDRADYLRFTGQADD